MSRKEDELAGPGISTYAELREIIPRNYVAELTPRDTQRAISVINVTLKEALCNNLNLEEVQVPLIVSASSGVNDYLDRNGARKPVAFTIQSSEQIMDVEVVQAATKWKRLALRQFGYTETTSNPTPTGLLTHMTSLRPGYFLDHDHCTTVTQFDWELPLRESERNLETLRRVVRGIYAALLRTEEEVMSEFPALRHQHPDGILARDITFVHAEELIQMYPDLPRKQRETELVKQYGSVFLIGIGYTLQDGYPHELRAIDYDDWVTPNGVHNSRDGSAYHGLNGDIIVWNPVTKRRHELSSMGIRVNGTELLQQAELCHKQIDPSLPYYSYLLSEEVCSAIGGGIGLERVYMLLLVKAHIGEVTVTPWPNVMHEICEEFDIPLLI